MPVVPSSIKESKLKLVKAHLMKTKWINVKTAYPLSDRAVDELRQQHKFKGTTIQWAFMPYLCPFAKAAKAKMMVTGFGSCDGRLYVLATDWALTVNR